MDLKNTCDHCSFVAQSEVRECYSSSSGFLFKVVLDTQDFCVSIQILIFLVLIL